MQDVLNLEAESLKKAASNLSKQASEVAQLENVFLSLMNFNGSLVFCGVGKSGIIAQKLAATFTSLGLNSFFLHPVEALHGDLGRVKENDSIVLISKSGTTEEIIKLLPYLPVKKENLIGLLGNSNSSIGKSCGLVLDCSVEKEACINNQAPTTSTTVALAMGDAMAVLYEDMVGLSKEGFAVNHPGGILGKSLRMKVKDLLIPLSECAVVDTNSKLKDVILLMTKYPTGACAVVDQEQFVGVLVEGDIRRTFTNKTSGLETSVSDIVNRQPITSFLEELAYDALLKMETKNRSVHVLPVVEKNSFKGFIRLHDLLKEGFSLPK